PNMSRKNLGEVVKQAREELGLTQRELAAQLGVKASHVAYIENNHRNPSLSLLRRLSTELGLNSQELLFLSHPDARFLVDTSAQSPAAAKRDDAWRKFSANRALLRRHRVTPA